MTCLDELCRVRLVQAHLVTPLAPSIEHEVALRLGALSSDQPETRDARGRKRHQKACWTCCGG